MNKNERIKELHTLAIEKLDKDHRSEFGQFMTPASIANFMASLFSFKKNVHLLDPGAGTGSLTIAVLDRILKNTNTHVYAELWEIDKILQAHLKIILSIQTSKNSAKNKIEIHNSDFIQDAFNLIKTGKQFDIFTHAIINPPYKKINNNSNAKFLLKSINIETVNLYAGFVALAIKLLAKNGELVAIIPRSFCNGAYYRQFRDIIFQSCQIKQIHLFESRRAAFKEDSVLQENVIIHLIKGGQKTNNVLISTSIGPDFNNLSKFIYPFSEIVQPSDKNKFIRIPTSKKNVLYLPNECKNNLDEIGIQVCTGPIVDFRLKKYLRNKNNKQTMPLLYPCHFQNKINCWPKNNKNKPSFILQNDETNKWLMPRGNYVLIKRFSSKEEKRRITAYHLGEEDFKSCKIGFENHWNILHANKKGLNKHLAHGLYMFLNSTLVDEHFRAFSGHTQVNASDLRNIKYPDKRLLIKIGKTTKNVCPTQNEIDSIINKLIISS